MNPTGYEIVERLRAALYACRLHASGWTWNAAARLAGVESARQTRGGGRGQAGRGMGHGRGFPREASKKQLGGVARGTLGILRKSKWVPG